MSPLRVVGGVSNEVVAPPCSCAVAIPIRPPIAMPADTPAAAAVSFKTSRRVVPMSALLHVERAQSRAAGEKAGTANLGKAAGMHYRSVTQTRVHRKENHHGQTPRIVAALHRPRSGRQGFRGHDQGSGEDRI